MLTGSALFVARAPLSYPFGRMPRGPQGFLQHGVDEHDALVAIDAVASGRCPLLCPYCSTPLIAKKGRILVPHFAHDGPTCREARELRSARIPLYDDFSTLEPLERPDLRLCASLAGRTVNESSLRGWRRTSLRRLVEAQLLEEVPRGQRWVNGVGSHRHTDWGTSVARATRYRSTLAELASMQERAALEKLDRLEASTEAADQTHLRLYRAQLARLLSLDLYFVAVKADRARLHKIGVTARPIEERLAEIRNDLTEHFRDVELKVEGVWPHRGSLELYFKRVFAKRQVRIGRLTEYFSFDAADSARRYRKPFTQLSKLESTLTPRLQSLISADA